MPNVGPFEVIVVAIVALVVFGPKRLPELGSSMGKGIREFRASITGQDNDGEKPEIDQGEQRPVERVEDEVVNEHRS
jgi:sec-independent protein translocase protein TatA